MTNQNAESAPPSLSAWHTSLGHRDELPKDNRLGVASLTLSILGCALIMLPYVTPALGLLGVCFGIAALAASRRTGKPKRAATWGLAIGAVAVVAGSFSTAVLMDGWHHYKSCNQRFDPVNDADENYACVHSKK